MSSQRAHSRAAPDTAESEGPSAVLRARREQLAQIEHLIEEARSQDKIPWTAISNLTKQQTKLAIEVAELEAKEAAEGEVTPEVLRLALLRLPAALVPVAQQAIAERASRMIIRD